MYCPLAAILRNEVAWFDHPDNSSGAVAARLASDATLVKAAITDRISVLVQNLSLLIVAFTISFILNWRMSLVIIATFPLLVVSAGAQVSRATAHPSLSLSSPSLGNARADDSGLLPLSCQCQASCQMRAVKLPAKSLRPCPQPPGPP